MYAITGALYTCQSGVFATASVATGGLAPFTTDGTNVTLPSGTFSVGTAVPEEHHHQALAHQEICTCPKSQSYGPNGGSERHGRKSNWDILLSDHVYICHGRNLSKCHITSYRTVCTAVGYK